MTTKRLLVIGGGIAGLSAIAGVRKVEEKQRKKKKKDEEGEDKIEIILAEPKDHCEIAWASYRSPFEEWVAEGSLLSLDSFCEKNETNHTRAIVTRLDLKRAVLSATSSSSSSSAAAAAAEDGEEERKNIIEIEFDVCLIACGAASRWPALGRGIPTSYDGTRAGRLLQIREEGHRLLSAGSVLIVGGGLIGAELAGDIAVYGREKAEGKKKEQEEDEGGGKGVPSPKVTLVHSNEQLCPEISAGAARKVQRKLEALGVTVLLNDRADEVDAAEGDGEGEGEGRNEKKINKKKMILRSTGEELDADEVVLTVGIQPINSFLEFDDDDGDVEEEEKGGDPKSSSHRIGKKDDVLDERGWIIADEYCRVKGTNNRLFAFGDCCTHMPNAGNNLYPNTETMGHNLLLALDSTTSATTTTNTTSPGSSPTTTDLDERRLRKIQPTPSIVCCTVGPKDGVFSTPLFSTQYIVPGIKNSTMFFDHLKDAIGYKENE